MKNKAFTLIELLVVIAIIALLLSIIVPSLKMAKKQALKVICSSNLKQQGLGLSLYAADNDEKLPYFKDENAFVFLWDVSYKTCDYIQEYVGDASPEFFFCPEPSAYRSTITAGGRTVNAIDYCWEGRPIAGGTGYRFLGYYYMIDRIGRPELDPKYNKQYVKAFTDRNPSGKELILDITLSQEKDGQEIFNRPPSSPVHTTNHLDNRNREPAGSNILFLDQHVDWRDFEEMHNQTPWHIPLGFKQWF